MTTKRIVYRRSDGVVEVVNPAPQRMAELMAEGKTEDEALAVIQANAERHLPDRGFGPMEDPEVMEASQIPYHPKENRIFRDALEKPGMGPPIVNMSKAREIKTIILSVEHDKHMAAIREEIEKAEDLGQNTTALKQKRDATRTIPDQARAALDAITTPEELEAWQPDWP